MFPQKFEKNGKKFVKFGEMVAELAPRELIEEISKKYEVTLEHQFTVEPVEVKAGEKINLSGWFEAPGKPGEYRINIILSTEGYAVNIPVKTKFRVREREAVVLSNTDVRKAIEAAFGDRAKGAQFWLADSKYYAANLADIQSVLQQTKIEQLKYVAEDFDCDDFSFTLMGALHANPYEPKKMPTAKQAVFIVWVWWKMGNNVYGHALNMCVTADKKVYMIEPQNDRIFNVPPNWNLLLVMG